ncbi:protein draper-like isoform X2 [Euwallacea fornicatus]|uniref:protein draper-like isoform X2 n=1 Tax=Euwallacea fornicatus TaxID=995702 RepID=UPI003390412C
MEITLSASFALLVLNLIISLAKFEGDNVCLKRVSYPEEQVIVDDPLYDDWLCPENSPICDELKVKQQKVKKVQHIIKWKEIEVCCDGYSKNLAENLCVPECSNDCFNGHCVAPNKCQCNQGFGGDNCNVTCPHGRYGENCSSTCNCPIQARCDPSNGECHCNPGFTGYHCEDRCVSGTYGNNCTKECKCENGYCHHVTGNCQCHPGYKGYSCDKLCPKGHYGEYCELKCKCQNSNETCNHVTGTCLCNDGWTKPDCSQKCPEGFWGRNCSQSCRCSTGSCNHSDGTCICSPGWTGIGCSEKCKDRTGLGLCDPGDNCNTANVFPFAITIGCAGLVVISIIAIGCHCVRKNGWIEDGSGACVLANNFIKNLFCFTKEANEPLQDQTTIERPQKLSSQISGEEIVTFVNNSHANNAPDDAIYSEILPEYDQPLEYDFLNHTGPINPHNPARYLRL